MPPSSSGRSTATARPTSPPRLVAALDGFFADNTPLDAHATAFCELLWAVGKTAKDRADVLAAATAVTTLPETSPLVRSAISGDQTLLSLLLGTLVADGRLLFDPSSRLPFHRRCTQLLLVFARLAFDLLRRLRTRPCGADRPAAPLRR